MSKLLLITGPAGAGKTTTCKEFLRGAPDVWAHLSQDNLRQLVRTGYASADGYEQDWSSETKRQWAVSIPICCDIAKRYLASGINCLIDFNADPEDFKVWQLHLKEIDYQLAVLLPDKQTVLMRNDQRDKGSRLKNNKILQNYDRLKQWQNQGALVINNSEGTVDETVKKLEGLIVSV